MASAATALLFATFAVCVADAADMDPQFTRIGYTLKTRWGQTLQGRFPRYSGEIEALPDGRRRARLRLDAREVEIIGYPSYTNMTRGDGFFDADHFPEVEFVSDPYSDALIKAGGKLGGELVIRSVRRHETFVVAPSQCARPAFECDVVATGSVRRSDYGVNRWMFAVSDHVHFVLRLRVREEATAVRVGP